jgi:hypothetical protein
MQQMYNITLVATIHSEHGECNPDELYKLLEEIKPEVIFDELPIHFAEMYYSDSFDMYCVNRTLLKQSPPVVPLEVKCIKKYKQSYNIEIVPVDIDVRQKVSEHQQEIHFMLQTFFKHEEYKKLDEEKDALISRDGFLFLNSNKYLGFIERKETMEKSIIESEPEKNRLLKIYNLFRAVQHDNRENTMLENIYDYSIDNPYNQAVFLIGAEHKRSIMQKIVAFEKLSKLKLNWTMYGII